MQSSKYVLVIDDESGDEVGDAIDCNHNNDASASKMPFDEQQHQISSKIKIA